MTATYQLVPSCLYLVRIVLVTSSCYVVLPSYTQKILTVMDHIDVMINDCDN